jgi:hypothetical protein
MSLSRALRDQQLNALAFTLYIYDDDDAEDSSVSSWAIASWRYASLHSHHDVSSSYYVDLVLAFGRAMALAPEAFKRLVTDVDELSWVSGVDAAAARSHRKKLIGMLGVDVAKYHQWEDSFK